jgi:hypothetical protein
MTDLLPTETDENEERACDYRAKAAVCRSMAGSFRDPELRQFYAELSAQWEEEAETCEWAQSPATKAA